MGLSSCVCTVLGCTLSCRTLPEDDAHFVQTQLEHNTSERDTTCIVCAQSNCCLLTLQLNMDLPTIAVDSPSYVLVLNQLMSFSVTALTFAWACFAKYQCCCGIGVTCAYSSDRRFEQMVSTSECIDVDAAVMST